MIRLLNNNGFTLTEVLVALSILLIISIAFLTLFVNSYSDIATSGLKSKGLYEIQTRIEQSIATGTSSEEKELIITFPDERLSIKATGTIQTEEMIVGGKKISISIFIPR